jgi:hypothetical protein
LLFLIASRSEGVHGHGLVVVADRQVMVRQLMHQLGVFRIRADQGLQGESRRFRHPRAHGGIVEKLVRLGVRWIRGELLLREFDRRERVLLQRAGCRQTQRGTREGKPTLLALGLRKRRRADKLPSFEKVRLLLEHRLHQLDHVAVIADVARLTSLLVKLTCVRGKLLFSCYRHIGVGLRR